MLLISGCAMAIAFGLGCIFEKELMWTLLEHDARLTGKVMRRVKGWENLLNMQGAVLIVIGVFGIFVAVR